MLSQQPTGFLVLPEKKQHEISITPVEVDADSNNDHTPRASSSTELSRRHQGHSIDAILFHIMDSPSVPRTSSVSGTTSSSSAAWVGPKSPPAPAKPKKWDAVFSYLTFREPSVQAMKQYEKDLKRKNGRNSTMTSGMAMSSTQKLPSSLPKVNSKWTGVPDHATRQRSKRFAPPKSTSQPALRSDSYRDDSASINSRYTGSSSLGCEGSSLWSSSYRDTRAEASLPSAQDSSGSLTNSTQIYSSGASSGSFTRTDLTNSALYGRPSGEATYASSLGSQPPRQSGQSSRSMKPPSLSETASVSTSYTTPLTPPPVPPEYLESATSQFYSTSAYRPKKSESSLMHDGYGHREQTTSLGKPQHPFVDASTPTPSSPRDPLAPHPFRKLRGPRAPEPGAEATSSNPQKSSDGSNSSSEAPSDTLRRRQRSRLSLRPEAMFGKKLDTAEPPQSASPDGRLDFLRRGSFRN